MEEQIEINWGIGIQLTTLAYLFLGMLPQQISAKIKVSHFGYTPPMVKNPVGYWDVQVDDITESTTAIPILYWSKFKLYHFNPKKNTVA